MSDPKLSFESERLLFRPLTENDLDLEADLWADPDVVKYVTGKTATREETAQRMPVVTQRTGGGCLGVWCLTDKTSGQKVGHAVLLPLPVAPEHTEWELFAVNTMPDREIEVGYILKKAFWGMGYATEACKRLLDFAFSETQLDYIVAVTDKENTASQQVLRKSGLKDQGMVTAFGEQLPGFRITRDEWLCLTPLNK